ncbi:MAG: hypothetical protein LLF98_10280 [Clostridium sp.]|uniref:hypothetical protein n=1 Tax=Clostridium sp. TaxID=1506 RepID=UPI0025C41266|nr:hypothetical protein [Clostridium sp.]MCE5221624.1 hypothetical protein [Clostridium sp.]
MNRKVIKCMITSLVFIGCLSTICKTTIAGTMSYSLNDLESSTFYAHNDNVEKSNDAKKDKHKGFDLFNKENFKYLSSDQKKELLELKKCKDKGEKLSEDQQKTLHSIRDCIVKGKLGDENYKDFKSLMEKKRSNEKLTTEEETKLKEYKDIIDGSKLSTKEIFNEFFR